MGCTTCRALRWVSKVIYLFGRPTWEYANAPCGIYPRSGTLAAHVREAPCREHTVYVGTCPMPPCSRVYVLASMDIEAEYMSRFLSGVVCSFAGIYSISSGATCTKSRSVTCGAR